MQAVKNYLSAQSPTVITGSEDKAVVAFGKSNSRDVSKEEVNSLLDNSRYSVKGDCTIIDDYSITTVDSERGQAVSKNSMKTSEKVDGSLSGGHDTPTEETVDTNSPRQITCLSNVVVSSNGELQNTEEFVSDLAEALLENTGEQKFDALWDMIDGLSLDAIHKLEETDSDGEVFNENEFKEGYLKSILKLICNHEKFVNGWVFLFDPKGCLKEYEKHISSSTVSGGNNSELLSAEEKYEACARYALKEMKIMDANGVLFVDSAAEVEKLKNYIMEECKKTSIDLVIKLTGNHNSDQDDQLTEDDLAYLKANNKYGVPFPTEFYSALRQQLEGSTVKDFNRVNLFIQLKSYGQQWAHSVVCNRMPVDKNGVSLKDKELDKYKDNLRKVFINTMAHSPVFKNTWMYLFPDFTFLLNNHASELTELLNAYDKDEHSDHTHICNVLINDVMDTDDYWECTDLDKKLFSTKNGLHEKLHMYYSENFQAFMEQLVKDVLELQPKDEIEFDEQLIGDNTSWGAKVHRSKLMFDENIRSPDSDNNPVKISFGD